MKSKKPTIAGQLQFTMPYEKKQISSEILCSGQPYQRKIRPARVSQIVNEFDPKLLDDVTVSFRGGRYNVVDGQHRIVALKMINGGVDVMVPCQVIYNLTYEQEADLYNRLDASKKRLTVADSTRAKIEARNDPEILDIQRILKAYGFAWEFSSGGGNAGNNKIAAARAVMNAYRLLGSRGFERMSMLLRQTWDGMSESLNSYMLSGIALFLSTYEDDIDSGVFIKKLSKVSPCEIVSTGRSDVSTRNNALKFARVILGKYNGKSRDNALPYRFNG